MKAEDIRKMELEDIKTKLKETKEEGFNLRFRHSLGQLEKPSLLRQNKKEVARFLTIIKEKSLN